MSGKINYTYIHISLTYLVSNMGLTNFVAKPVFVLRSTLLKLIIKYKKFVLF